MAFDASSIGGMAGGGGGGRTATSSAPTTISPVYGVSGGNVALIVGLGAAAVALVFILMLMFGGKRK